MSKKSITIKLRGAVFRCVIGAHTAERHARQQVRFDVEVVADAPAPGKPPPVDYFHLLQILRAVENENFVWLEDAAEDAAARVLAHFPAREVRVYCAKPRVFAEAEEAGVEVVRRREE